VEEAYRSYYVYLLDYGWDETFGEAKEADVNVKMETAIPR
jgi:hypothetical protein